MSAIARSEMIGDSISQKVERLLSNGKEKRFYPLELTRADGRLTAEGKAFARLRPAESLDHYDRSTERLTDSQVYATDYGGEERLVGRMIDGVMVPTQRGLAYYGAGELVSQLESQPGAWTAKVPSIEPSSP